MLRKIAGVITASFAAVLLMGGTAWASCGAGYCHYEDNDLNGAINIASFNQIQTPINVSGIGYGFGGHCGGYCGSGSGYCGGSCTSGYDYCGGTCGYDYSPCSYSSCSSSYHKPCDKPTKPCHSGTGGVTTIAIQNF
ncbi:hypothetical protein GCM10012275_24050 [Longimycelium tulufanense]|uniref:Uncharacterized protein n=1 Tax=Longimycelium tulufanense TaxID=907463 RepID=A0A8J3C817_9PSEU|nr:hypothetical protein [Longimycelium tulufanense]GGM52277.1 hypothetical protein GCM10012275_24050 [Longimycelium tulufanense]